MPIQYKLTYFNAKARAEVARLIFAYAGVPFEDFRIEREEWPKYKPNTPNGQLPVIEIDGKVYSQSNAICRYLAKQFGLNGKTSLEALKIDMIVDTVEDLLKHMFCLVFEQSEEKKVANKKKFEEEQLPEALKNLEKMLIDNNGGDGYFVGDGLTWADLMIFNWITVPATSFVGSKVDLSKFPKLEALYERVKKQPQISEWLEKRPETQI